MPDPITEQAERLADAYTLGIKAEVLREFATELEGVPHYPAAILARLKAGVLDAQAEELAAANTPAAPAEPTPELTRAQRLAEQIIRDAITTALDNYSGIVEQLPDDATPELMAAVEAHMRAIRYRLAPERADTPEAGQ